MKRMIPSSKLTIKNDKLTAMEGIYDAEGNQIIADGGSLVAGNPEVPVGTSPTELSGLSVQNGSTKQYFKITHSPVVEANPVDEASGSLSKLKVGSSTYSIPQGTEVEANPQGIVGAVLESIKIGNSNYAIPGGMPTQFDDIHPRLTVNFSADIITGWTEKGQLQLNYGDILWIAYSSEDYGGSFGCARVLSHTPRDELTIETSLPVVDSNSNSVVVASINLYVDHDDPDETTYINPQNVVGADISIADGTLILY